MDWTSVILNFFISVTRRNFPPTYAALLSGGLAANKSNVAVQLALHKQIPQKYRHKNVCLISRGQSSHSAFSSYSPIVNRMAETPALYLLLIYADQAR